MIDPVVTKLAQRIDQLGRTVQGQARTRQLARSSVALTEYGVDENGDGTSAEVDVPLSDLVGAVPVLTEEVAGHGEDLGLLDESTSQTVLDVSDVQEQGGAYSDEAHDAQTDVTEAWEHAADTEVAHNMLVEHVYNVDERVDEAQAAAEAAAEAAANAQTTADGKNARRRGKTEPAPPEGGWTQGDQWVVENDAGKPVELRVWNGTAWVRDQTLADEILVLGEDGTVRIGDGQVSSPNMTADVFEGKTFRGGTFVGGLVQGSIFELLGVAGTQTLLSDSGTTANIGKWGAPLLGFPAALDASDGHNSAPCIRTTNTESNPTYFGIWVRQNSEIPNLTATTDVVAALWVKVPSAANAQLTYGTLQAAPVALPANTWTQLSIAIPKGADPSSWLVVNITGATLAYALADDFTVTGNVYDARSILINRLSDGTPGVRVLDSQGRVITTLDPTGFVSKGALGGTPRASLSGGQLEFDNQNGLGTVLALGPSGIRGRVAGVPIQLIHEAAGAGSNVEIGAAGPNRIRLLSTTEVKKPWNSDTSLVGGFTDYNSSLDRAYFGGGDGAAPTTADHTYFAVQHGSGTTDTQNVAWIQSNVAGVGRQVLAIRRSGHVLADHLPFAMAAGGYASVTVAVGGVGKQTVNYPAGRFTISPLVTGSVSNGIRDVTFSTENRSATSFVAVLGAAGSTVSRTVEFHWQAIQMTPTTAGG